MSKSSTRGARPVQRHAGAVRTTAVVATLAVAVAVLPAAAASAEDGRSEAIAADPRTDPGPAPGEPLLGKPRGGAAAVQDLGEDVDLAARRNDLSAGTLVSLLREDPTARLDRAGLLHYIDPSSPDDEREPRSRWVGWRTRVATGAPGPFALHSKPGARLTIFLDADGGYVRGTRWNGSGDHGYSLGRGSHPAWDPAQDGPSLNPAEQEGLREVWAAVAEDFAPFDVDVTTEDPGAAALVDSGGTDRRWGARVMLTPSDEAWSRICSRRCGGASYVDVFRKRTNNPSWVFTEGLGNSPKRMAEAASHEVGHTLGLSHDGDATSREYSAGRDGWAPVMGVGYYQPITQWSRGDYTGATNREDDLSVIGGYLRRRRDESSPASPAPLDETARFVTASNDVDATLLGSCAAGTTVRVQPAAVSPNLDVRASLVDSRGVVVASADPLARRVDETAATGLDASLAVPRTGDGWTVRIKGTGRRGIYPGYGSLGAYTVRAPGCDGAESPRVARPGRVARPRLRTSGRRLSVRWRPPAGTAPVTGYRVAVKGARARTVGPRARTAVFRGLSRGRHTVRVVARNSAGAGRPSPVAAIRVR